MMSVTEYLDRLVARGTDMKKIAIELLASGVKYRLKDAECRTMYAPVESYGSAECSGQVRMTICRY